MTIRFLCKAFLNKASLWLPDLKFLPLSAAFILALIRNVNFSFKYKFSRATKPNIFKMLVIYFVKFYT